MKSGTVRVTKSSHPSALAARCGRALQLLSLGLTAACASAAGGEREDEIAGATAALTIAELTNPPSYLGTARGANCGAAEYTTLGYAPTEPGRYPLFLYFVGTGDSPDQPAARLVAQAMAARGYLALAVDYDNELDLAVQQVLTKAACMYDPNATRSLVRAACARSDADCAAGTVTWGHSQGALMAVLGASYDARVRGAWGTGIGQPLDSRAWTISLMLPQDRLRLVNGEDDGFVTGANNITALNEITGRSCSRGSTNAGANCFTGPNQSGWYLVDNNELAQNPADHCWFYKLSCNDSASNLEPNWSQGSSPFALGPNADWLAATGDLAPVGARDLSFNFAGLSASALSGQYPAGTVDWGIASNFNTAAGTPSHAYIGPFWSESPATGSFRLWGREGRTLQSVTLVNTGSSESVLSASITLASGTVLPTRTQRIAAGGSAVIPYAVANAKSVSFTSSNGARLQFRQVVVGGAAESPTP